MGFHEIRHLDAEGVSIIAVREVQGVEQAVAVPNHARYHQRRNLSRAKVISIGQGQGAALPAMFGGLAAV